MHHVGGLPELEDQMCNWVPNVDDISPDRVDALVWAMTNLLGLMIAGEQTLLFQGTQDVASLETDLAKVKAQLGLPS